MRLAIPIVLCLVGITVICGCGGGEDATDAGPDGSMDAAACPYEPGDRVGWVRTWGGDRSAQGLSVKIDNDGNVIVVGTFTGTVDFDPGPGEDLQTASAEPSPFLSKYSAIGEYLGTRTFEGKVFDVALGLGVMQDGSIVMAGGYLDTMDFDPGAGKEERTSTDDQDVFVVNLSPDGGLAWVYTIQGQKSQMFTSVAVSLDDEVIVGGLFKGEIIFPADPEDEVHPGAGAGASADAWVAKLSKDGKLVWGKVFEADNDEEVWDVAVSTDGSVVVYGEFGGTMDFDPGDGIDEHVSDNINDLFLIKLDSDGNYVWSRQITGPGIEFGRAVAVDGNGNIYAGVEHSYPVNFDSDSSKEEAGCDNNYCFTIAKYSADGIFAWASTISGSGVLHNVKDLGPTTDGLIVAGYFEGEADFDPGPGKENRSVPDGEWRWDAFILKLSFSGEYQWVTNIGDPGACTGLSVANDLEGYSYLTGYFVGTVDFNPSECKEQYTCGEEGDAFLLRLNQQGHFYSTQGRK